MVPDLEISKRKENLFELRAHNRHMLPREQTRLLERKVRLLLVGFVVGLVLSGITAFPLPQEMVALCHWLGVKDGTGRSDYSGLTNWVVQVRDELHSTESRFPFLFYGYDWLAFAHLVIAVLFIGPIKDPVRNIWVVQWGMIACLLIFPLALICGPIRGIPFGWRLIDCSFGVIGIVPLYFCYRWIGKLEVVKDERSV